MPTKETATMDPGATYLAASGTMKGLVYHGPGQRAWEQAQPVLRDPGDAIVRITARRSAAPTFTS
jgi:hypothetical protein